MIEGNTKRNEEYVKIRENCIEAYGSLYKDSIVFDFCKVGKTDRVRLVKDPIYIAETKAAKAELFLNQLDVLDKLIDGSFGPSDKDKSSTILRAIELKQKLLLEDIGINNDPANCLNIVFTEMSQEDFQSMGKIEIEEGDEDADLDDNFGLTSDNLSAEEKAKKLLIEQQRKDKLVKSKKGAI